MVLRTEKYDLEERTFSFASNCKEWLKLIPVNVHNREYYKQLIRSSGSVAANYIEANESLSKKDFVFRVRVAKKEIKESRMWLRLIDTTPVVDEERNRLIKETEELMLIFASITRKSTTDSV